MSMKIPLTATLLTGAVMLVRHSTPAQAPENKAAKSEQKPSLLEKKVLGVEAARKMMWHQIVSRVGDCSPEHEKQT
jgi:hypothetical protein